jgi:hypothetical protein
MEKSEIIRRLWEAIMADTADDTALGIPVIDDALPYLKNHRIAFLGKLRYLMEESQNSVEIGEKRGPKIDEAEQYLRVAAALMEAADNGPMAALLRSFLIYTPHAKTGVVYPKHLTRPCADAPEGEMILMALVQPEALSAEHSGRGGPKARDANIVKAIAQHFPDSQKFLSASDGYSIIANLAALCGLTGKTAQSNPNKYVRSLLKKGHT